MKPLKMAKQGLVIGSLATAMLFGSVLGAGAAFAADTTSYSSVVEKRLKQVVSDAAMYGNTEEANVRLALANGSELAQAAGLTRSELRDKLVASMNEDIDLATRGNASFTDEQKAALKQEAEKQIETILSTAGYNDASLANVTVNYDRILDRQLALVVQNVSTYANVRETSLRQSLQTGNDLVQASGMKREELLSKLIASFAQEIDSAAQNDTSMTAEKREGLLADARKELDTILSTAGYDDAARKQRDVNYDRIVNRALSLIVINTSTYANVEESSLRESLRSGKDLVQASGMKRQELTDRLVNALAEDIDSAAQNDASMTGEKRDELLADAVKQIGTILSTAGYDDAANKQQNVNYDRIVDRALKLIVINTSTYGNIEESSLRESLRSGKDLVQASGMKRQELTNRLVNSLAQDIDVAAQYDASMTAEKREELLADAAKQISTILSTVGYGETN